MIYTIRQMAEDLNRSERTITNALNELKEAGLLIRVRQGWNKANRLFLQLPDMVQVSSRPDGKNCALDRKFSSTCIAQNLPTSNTDLKPTEKSQLRGEGTRRCLGEFRNVFLAEDEYSALQADFPDRCGEYIERLSRYMAANDRRYANHCAVLRKWLAEDGRSAGRNDYGDYQEGECL